MASPYKLLSTCNLPTLHGVLEMQVYDNGKGTPSAEAIVMVARVRHGQYTPTGATMSLPASPRGEFVGDAPLDAVVMRVHDQCQTSEVFGSVKCDCKQQLEYALELLCDRSRRAWRARHDAHGCAGACSDADADDAIVGLVIYMKQEGRGIGLAAKVSAYALQEAPDGSIAGFDRPAVACCSAGRTARTFSAIPAEVAAGALSPVASSASIASLETPAATADVPATSATPASRGLDTVDANRALGLPDDSREYSAVIDVLKELGLIRAAAAATATPAAATTAPAAAAAGSAGISISAAPLSPSLAPSDTGAGATPGLAAAASTRPLYLLSNNPRKRDLLQRLGLVIPATVPCHVPPPSPLAASYMQAKAERMGHDIPAAVFRLPRVADGGVPVAASAAATSAASAEPLSA